jgi:hypothetical protein
VVAIVATLLCCVALQSVNSQPCLKPVVWNFTLASNETISISGVFSGTEVRCRWYFNDVLNSTTNGTINGNTILCPITPTLLNYEDDSNYTGSPPTGLSAMASQMGLNNDDVKIDVELQVYYSSTSNPLAANCLSDKISIAGKR